MSRRRRTAPDFYVLCGRRRDGHAPAPAGRGSSRRFLVSGSCLLHTTKPGRLTVRRTPCPRSHILSKRELSLVNSVSYTVYGRREVAFGSPVTWRASLETGFWLRSLTLGSLGPDTW